MFHEGLNEVLATLQLVGHALIARNMPLAKKICATEAELDKRYQETIDEVLGSLDTTANKRDAITFLNMMHYLERMGDIFLNIGEAIVFAAVGARLKLQDYVALADMVTDVDSLPEVEGIQIERIWDSRSGMSIGRVHGRQRRRGPRPHREGGQPREAGSGARQHQPLAHPLARARAPGVRLSRERAHGGSSDGVPARSHHAGPDDRRCGRSSG